MKFIHYFNIKTTAWCVFAVWIIMQIIEVICFWDYPQYPDAHHYMEEALSHFQRAELYPSYIDLYDRWIQSPGMANYLLLIYAIFGTFKVVMLFNIIMNVIIAVDIYILAKHFFNKQTACLSILVYSLQIPNIFIPIHILSEIPFLFLCMTAFCLGLSMKWYRILLSSVVFFIALTFRPQMVFFFMALFVYYFVTKRKIMNFVLLVVPFIICYVGYGEYNRRQVGYFVVNSTTGGECLLTIANDSASLIGGNRSGFLPDEAVRLENEKEMTFHERDSIWSSMAVEWIKHHPVRYTLSVCFRVLRLFQYDYWGYPIQEEITSNSEPSVRIKYAILSIPFYILCLFYFISLWKNKKDILSQKGLFLLIFLFFIGGSSLVYVEHRYHFPFVWIMCIWVAYGIDRRLSIM